jgi:hypothetical protein
LGVLIGRLLPVATGVTLLVTGSLWDALGMICPPVVAGTGLVAVGWPDQKLVHRPAV